MKITQLRVLPFAAALLLQGSVALADRATMSSDDPRVGPNAAVTFEPGEAILTSDAKMKLNALAERAEATKRDIAKIEIAAWADTATPKEGETLSKADRDLAQARAKAVQAYLKRSIKGKNTDTYNMAERANWLARVFDTSDAQLKGEVTNESENPLSREDFKIFKSQGTPSKAVVVVLMKDRNR